MVNLANPTAFVELTRRVLPWLAAATAVLFVAGLWLSFAAPPDYQQGETVKIMYLHVPAAWMATFVYARHDGRGARHAGLAPSPRRRGAEGGGAARRGIYLHLPRHRLALGQADVGHLLGVGRAPDLGAGAVHPLSRPHRAVARDRRSGPRGQSGGDPDAGWGCRPADHQILRRLVEHPASAGVGVPARRSDDRARTADAAHRDVARLHLPFPDAASDGDPQRNPAPADRPGHDARGRRGRSACARNLRRGAHDAAIRISASSSRPMRSRPRRSAP